MADLKATLYVWPDGRMLAQCSAAFTGEAQQALKARLVEIRGDWNTGKPVVLGPEWKVVPVVTFA